MIAEEEEKYSNNYLRVTIFEATSQQNETPPSSKWYGYQWPAASVLNGMDTASSSYIFPALSLCLSVHKSSYSSTMDLAAEFTSTSLVNILCLPWVALSMQDICNSSYELIRWTAHHQDVCSIGCLWLPMWTTAVPDYTHDNDQAH